jgi:MSHA biogenesis protein MshI
MKIPDFFYGLSGLLGKKGQRVGWFAVCIKAGGVYFAHVTQGGSKPRVQMCAFHPVDKVTPQILERLRRDARIADFQFTTLLAPGEYQMQLLDAPNVKADEMKAAIRWRIKDSLSYLIDDATIDLLKIPPNKEGGERPQSLYAVAAHNNTIKKIEALFESAKIDLNVIDIPEMAQRNVAALFEEEGRGLALLAPDDGSFLLTFTSGGELYLARRIEITQGQLQSANEGQREQSLERLELELQRSMDYFGRQFSHISVRRLLVAAPPGLNLVGELAGNLDLPVEQLDLAQGLDISAVPKLTDGEFAAHALHAIGAALRHERREL